MTFCSGTVASHCAGSTGSESGRKTAAKTITQVYAAAGERHMEPLERAAGGSSEKNRRDPSTTPAVITDPAPSSTMYSGPR